MKVDELRSMWKAIEPLPKTDQEIRAMLKENKHPVLKGIRKQITIEITCWVVFLICYYTMFDGAAKPFLINILLIIAILTPLIHNLYGYNFAKYSADASTIKKFLKLYLRRMKIYAIRSIVSRIIFTCGLMLFFSYNINFNASKYFILSAVTLLLILIQTFFLYKIWMKRIKSIRKTLTGLS